MAVERASADLTGASERSTLLLSVDFEDWHQLARRRAGATDWRRPGAALARQTQTLLDLLDEIGARASFFVLGLAARAHPELVAEIAARGHEIACHGDMHELVHTLTPAQFAADVRTARELIEQIARVRPLGYRAPAFSITAAARWAYDVLAEEGFAYDSSQHDSPRIRGRIAPASAQPHALELEGGRTLWELPLAVWRVRGRPVPVGGASYWALLPRRAVLHGLNGAGELAGLYLHPHELDPEPLRASAPAGAPLRSRAPMRMRQLHRNLARARASSTLRAIAAEHRLITYGEAHAKLSAGAGAGP
ncbi:MAG: polysaccharide deacetylase family protein [Solirubrobacteraceae bacterium]